jgi:internalin A
MSALCCFRTDGNIGFEILRKLHRLKALDLDLVTLLDLPPELSGTDVQTVLSYLRELFLASSAAGEKPEDSNSIIVKRMKIMMVGPGEAGKTTLVHRLIEGKFEGGFSMTDGVSMADLIVDDLRISLWDFSGQSVYMNTHSLFFSTRTVFMIVWNPRQHENETMLFLYFNTVRNCSPLAPIILVSTHAKDTSRMSDGTLEAFEEKFGPPAGFGPISCYHHIDSYNGFGIQELKRDMVKVALQLPHVTQRIPRIFKKLEAGLKELSNHGRFSLTPAEFFKYASGQYGIDEDSAQVALGLMNEWGQVHLLAEGDIVLEPQKLAQVRIYIASLLYRHH